MKTAVMTGPSSGIGKAALTLLRGEKDIRVIAGSRTEIPDSFSVDLSSLDSVRNFAGQIRTVTGNSEIDILILNAGVQTRSLSRSAEGYELTFAVNHLSHYLLLSLLWNSLSEGARIVMTSSGTYDPAEKTIIPPPRHANARMLAFPEQDPQLDTDPVKAGGRAYSSSKLCVMLTVLYLNGDAELKKRGIRAIAYDPGPTPGTGLVRNGGPVLETAWKILQLPLLRNVFKGSNSVSCAGNALADIALGRIEIDDSCHYAALRSGRMTFPPLSDLAKRQDLAEKLWKESAVLCGIEESNRN